jgi:hypothetical protein
LLLPLFYHCLLHSTYRLLLTIFSLPLQTANVFLLAVATANWH